MKHWKRWLLAGLVGVWTMAYAADTAIWSLTDGTTANGTDRIPVARDVSTNVYITPAYIWTYIQTLFGTGVATALGANVGSAGAVVVNGGAGGTPSSLTLTNATGLPVGGISATGTPSSSTYLRGDGTWNTPSGGGNVSNSGTPAAGQAAEWTSATVIQGVAVTGTGSYVKATSPTLVTPALGTPASGVLTNATGLPISTGVSGLGANVAAALANAKDATGGLAGACPTAGQANIGGTCQAVRPIIYSGAQALGTTAIASGACATTITITATGLATTSTIDLTWAATPVGVTGYSPSVTTGRLSVDAYPTANTVNISVCNPTAASITPGAMSVNVVAY